jgi:hypothetical protein
MPFADVRVKPLVLGSSDRVDDCEGIELWLMEGRMEEVAGRLPLADSFLAAPPNLVATKHATVKFVI